jgi:hypothetical protein
MGKLSDEQKISVRKGYENGLSTYALAKRYNVSPSSINRLLKNRGVVLRGPKKHIYNVDYFKDINTPDKAYWLGLLYADGYVHKYGLTLKLIDRDHIEKFRCTLASDHPIEEDHKNENTVYILRVSDVALPPKLAVHGLVNKKSFRLVFPNLHCDLVSHFVRGYFDGDGHVCCAENGQWQIGFTSLSGDFLADIQRWFDLSGSLNQTKKGCWQLSYNGNGVVPKVAAKIVGEPYLTRKYMKIKKVLQWN